MPTPPASRRASPVPAGPQAEPPAGADAGVQDAPRAHTPPAAGPLAGAAATLGAAPARRPAAPDSQARAIPPARPATPDLQLAGYLLARELVGRPVAAPAQALLQRVNASKKDVLQQMRYGRANLSTDLEATANQGLHRLLAQRHVTGSMSTLSQPSAQTYAQDAAIAARVGAGNCGEFAFVAAHVHAGRLQPGEQLVVQKAGNFDHSWALVEGRASPGGTTPRAVLDVWSEGPVIEPGDGSFTGGARGAPLNQHTITHADAAELSRRFEATRNDPGGSTARRLETLIAANRNNDRQPTGTVYEPMPGVDARFSAEARRAVQARRHDPDILQAAAAFGREVAGLAPEGEAEVVERILHLAAHLDVPLPRHLEAQGAKRQRTEADDAQAGPRPRTTGPG